MRKCVKYFLFFSVFFSAFLCVAVKQVSAEYVLPYPSYMPGNKVYMFSRLIDKLEGFWHWGNIAKIKYHMNLSDKYLVEAKTLFEYKQYLLASEALKRSDGQVERILPYVQAAIKQGKDMKNIESSISEEMLVHRAVIEVMQKLLPDEFVWQPEKVSATTLPISSMLEHSITIRQNLHDSIQTATKLYTYHLFVK